jgi:hypothetical protein
MIRTQVRLTEEQAEALKALAAKCGVSMAELIRRSVEQLLTKATSPQEDQRRRALTIAGRFHSGRADIAAEHDRYLAEP